ncbi:MAG: hypothetical protein AB1490_28385 [Pseudomonadota bacterium]
MVSVPSLNIQRREQATARGVQAMPGLEQVASPDAGFVQTRQPSLHSVQAASGGVKALSGAGVKTGADTGAAFGFGKSRSAAIADHERAASITIGPASHCRRMAARLPSRAAQVERAP